MSTTTAGRSRIERHIVVTVVGADDGPLDDLMSSLCSRIEVLIESDGPLTATAIERDPREAIDPDAASDWQEDGVRGCSCGMADHGAPGHDLTGSKG